MIKERLNVMSIDYPLPPRFPMKVDYRWFIAVFYHRINVISIVNRIPAVEMTLYSDTPTLGRLLE